MIEVSKCVVCDGAIRRLKRALVAPFLARRIWGRPAFCVDLVECGACGFAFYNPRLDDAEAARLYAGYRSDEYWRMRHAFEPWYTRSFHSGLSSPDSFENRRRALAALLRQQIGTRKVQRVLDFGGDRGDLVRGLFDGAAAFVYDISGVPAVDGVAATAEPVACNADLIINSNVLEHVGFPRRVVEAIREAAPAGGMAFLEVPCESPVAFRSVFKRAAQAGIMALARPALTASVARPASLYMMHEHINCFTVRSLTALMSSCGFEVIAARAYSMHGWHGEGDMAWCLGTAT